MRLVSTARTVNWHHLSVKNAQQSMWDRVSRPLFYLAHFWIPTENGLFKQQLCTHNNQHLMNAQYLKYKMSIKFVSNGKIKIQSPYPDVKLAWMTRMQKKPETWERSPLVGRRSSRSQNRSFGRFFYTKKKKHPTSIHDWWPISYSRQTKN